jgi:transcriptional regulator with XRE-family HTH domain
MNDLTVGRVLRAVRVRKGWRQVDVAVRATVSQQEVSLVERGNLEEVCIATLRRIGSALEVDLPLAPRWRGPELDRLLDAGHASLVDVVIRVLQAEAWEVLPEWTFNHYGERGSVDIVAWHAASRTLLIIEIKTRIVDVQDLLASHGRKARIGPLVLPGERGWEPLAIGRVLVLADSTTNRSAIARHGATFEAAYPARTRAIRAWIHQPNGPVAGVLFVRPTDQASSGSSGTRVRVERSPERCRRTNGVGTRGPDATLHQP